MNLQRTSLAAAALLAAASASQAATAGLPTGLDWIDSNTNLTFYGDLRLRFEADWDSQNAAGVERDDRNRGRLRARAGFNYKVSDAWSFGSRIRTGSSRSQQSPHLTFAADDGLRDDLDFVADRYFVQFKQDAFTGWAGRNTSPFWQGCPRPIARATPSLRHVSLSPRPFNPSADTSTRRQSLRPQLGGAQKARAGQRVQCACWS